MKSKWSTSLSSLNSQKWLTYGATFGLLFLSTAMGFVGLGITRLIFMLGCIILGYIAIRDSPGRHLEVVIILFSFTPFVRRVIDLGSGFDMLGIMLSGPLLTMLLPCIELRGMITGKISMERTGPFIIVGLCILYGCMISLFTGDFQSVEIQGLKYGTPLLYGLWILIKCRDHENDMIGHAATAFLVVTPIMGIYGVLQFLDPMPWDRYWMIYSDMGSIGNPEPFEVRVFSTMNSPASFATFAAVGLLVFSFTRTGWQAGTIAITVALALLLSQYRTAWIAMFVGLLYCWMYPSTRVRSTVFAVGAVVAAVLAMTNGGPVGDVVSQRFDTFSQGANDGSAVERMSEYTDFYRLSDQYIFGKGFGMLSGAVPGLVALDGQIIGCYLVMGIFVGTICLVSLVWATMRAVSNIRLRDDPMRVVTGAVSLGLILTMPLAGIMSAEAGFLFWTFVAIATASAKQPTYSWRQPYQITLTPYANDGNSH